MNYILATMLLFSAGALSAKNAPKYVFYFIGDGMGLNQVLGAEIYQANADGKTLEYDRFAFSEFPVNTYATSKSASTYITDSSAAGTALATGHKTVNSMLGVKADGVTPVNSIAYYANKAGYKVGIASSVGVNHATPASFYGHNKSRSAYYELGLQLTESDFDFFGAGGFLGEVKDSAEKPSLANVARKAGYTIAWGKEQYEQKKGGAEKMILFQHDSTATSLPYYVDKKESDLTLSQITESAIEFLSKDNKKGFFLMVEGGMIDSGGHSNDVVVAYGETIAFAEAIDVALEFYRQHPKETLIVVTADHETGGLALGTAGVYDLNYQYLHCQKGSKDAISRALGALRIQNNNNVSWEQVKEFLKENFGFWDKIQPTMKQEIKLMEAYDASFSRIAAYGRDGRIVVSGNEPVVQAAVDVLYEQALVSFSSGSHTAVFVPVYAIGVGADAFVRGGLDNTDLPKIIAELAGYPIE